MIIDAKNLIVGRLATKVAKLALLGEEVSVLNCNEAILTGKKEEILAAYKRKRSMGTPSKGPVYHRIPEKMLKRIIRGMLPYKKPRGDAAFKKIKCYNTVPEQFQGKESLTLKEANVKKLPNLKFITLKRLCELL
jgi:large subunit ribosomal protein L13